MVSQGATDVTADAANPVAGERRLTPDQDLPRHLYAARVQQPASISGGTA